jgi:hypothetical protein
MGAGCGGDDGRTNGARATGARVTCARARCGARCARRAREEGASWRWEKAV